MKIVKEDGYGKVQELLKYIIISYLTKNDYF